VLIDAMNQKLAGPKLAPNATVKDVRSRIPDVRKPLAGQLILTDDELSNQLTEDLVNVLLGTPSAGVLEQKPAISPIVTWSGESLSTALVFHNIGVGDSAKIFNDTKLGRNVFSFSGDGGYLEGNVDDLPYSSNQRTLSLWVKYRTISNDFNEAFLGGYGHFGEYAHCYAITTTSSGHPVLTTWGPSLASVTAVETNTWHHVAVTTREDKGAPLSSVYFDGVLEKEEHITVNTTKSTKIYFGGLPMDIEKASYPYISRKLDGEIRNISLYDVALSAGNIKYLYNHEKSL
jgi:hypothetical protein